MVVEQYGLLNKSNNIAKGKRRMKAIIQLIIMKNKLKKTNFGQLLSSIQQDTAIT